MTLKTSCDALYFPEEPRDNVINLKWEFDPSDPLEPFSLLVYKAKCTAPHLFHVLPRYGAILLTGQNGEKLPGKSSISFGLREHYSGQQKDASTATPSKSGRKYQERFALEYLVIHSESAAHLQVSQAASEPLRMAEAVKSIWNLVTSRTIPQSHVKCKGGANLKVYLTNVLLSGESAGPESVVVPKEAILLPPSLQERLGSAKSPNSASHYSPSASSQRGSVGASATLENELRQLRDEITTLKENSDSPSRPAAFSAMSTPGSTSVPRSMTNERNASPAGTAGEEDAESVLMTWPPGGASASKEAPKKKKGMKLSRLLIIMFVFYVSCVLLFRSSAKSRHLSGVEEAAPLGKDGSNAAQKGASVDKQNNIPSSNEEKKGKDKDETNVNVNDKEDEEDKVEVDL